jgi:hypothetical protein
MAMALAGALRAVSANRPPERSSRANLEITLDGDPLRGIRAGAHSTTWCARCGAGFRMVTAFAASALADVSFRMLYRWAETEEIHFSVSVDGALFVCLDSLLERASAQD